jgi:hypothetical protein
MPAATISTVLAATRLQHDLQLLDIASEFG